MKRCIILLTVFAASLAAAAAGPRTSANYTIITDTTDGGGVRTTSANYTHDGSATMVGSLSTVASPAEFDRTGYIGQLYDVTTALAIGSASSNNSVNETATLQLAVYQVLDDTSYLTVNPASVAWSVVGGPITGISTGGLATAGVVYQNTPATVQGVYSSQTLQLGLTVIDSIPDNFGIYAGDHIPDSWQVQYFGLGTNGLGNPQGVASADADGTGQNNLFKYIAGLNPLDGTRFVVSVSSPVYTLNPVTNTAVISQLNVNFSPIAAGRTYLIAWKNLLSDPDWTAITGSAGSTPIINGTTETITDLSGIGNPNGIGLSRFYEVIITYP
jgi:hypothetical protein